MPIYEYECQACEKVHEKIQKFSDAPMKDCPECGKPVKKLMSKTTFALKGSGWYATDYKAGADPSPKPAASDAGKKTKSDGNADKTADSSQSKAESKSEPKTAPRSEGQSGAQPGSKSEKKSESKKTATE